MAEQEAIPVNIGNTNDGAMIEAFDLEFRKALENCWEDLPTGAGFTRPISSHDNVLYPADLEV